MLPCPLAQHAPADLWGVQTALDGAAQTCGRVEMNEYFVKRLADDFSDAEWKDSVAESVASGYVSRARAWGLIEPKLVERKYALTSTGVRRSSSWRSPPRPANASKRQSSPIRSRA